MNASLILFVLSAVACIVGLAAFWREKIAVFTCCLIIAVIGVTLGFRASFSNNKRIEETIQRAGPALINQLLSGETTTMPDCELPGLISRLASKLKYPPDVVARLSNPTNYTINFHLGINGVPTATNQLPKAPIKRQSPESQSSAMCRIQSHSHSP